MASSSADAGHPLTLPSGSECEMINQNKCTHMRLLSQKPTDDNRSASVYGFKYTVSGKLQSRVARPFQRSGYFSLAVS